MALVQLAPNLFRLSGFANMYLIEAPEGLILIDAGLPGDEKKVLKALADRGKQPQDLRHIILTHAHPDHIGSLAALVRATGARTYMHPADIPIAAQGDTFRPMPEAAVELLPRLMFKLLGGRAMTVPGTAIDEPIADGMILPLAGGLRVIATPGHSAGQIALYWPDRRVLFGGDVAMTLFGLTGPIAYESRSDGLASLRKIAQLDADIACFGHGKPILHNAGAKLKARWN